MFHGSSSRFGLVISISVICVAAMALYAFLSPQAPDDFASSRLGPLAVDILAHPSRVEAFKFCTVMNGVGCPAPSADFRSSLPTPCPGERLIGFNPKVPISTLGGLLGQLYNGANYRDVLSTKFRPEVAWRFLGSSGEQGEFVDVVVCLSTGRVHIVSYSSLDQMPAETWISRMIDPRSVSQAMRSDFSNNVADGSLK